MFLQLVKMEKFSFIFSLFFHYFFYQLNFPAKVSKLYCWKLTSSLKCIQMNNWILQRELCFHVEEINKSREIKIAIVEHQRSLNQIIILIHFATQIKETIVIEKFVEIESIKRIIEEQSIFINNKHFQSI